MAASVDGVRVWDLNGELNCFSDDQITNFISLAECYVDVETYDCVAVGLADKATNLLTGHLLISHSFGADSAAGQVTAESAGGLARTYAAVSGLISESPFSSTTFGRYFVQLSAGVPTTGLGVGLL